MKQSTAMVVGLTGYALAFSSPPAYTPSTWSSSASPAAVSSSSIPVYPASSSAIPYYPASSSSSSAAPWYPSSTFSSVVVSSSCAPSSSIPVGPASVSSVPASTSSWAATPTPSCWTACFQQNGITGESDLCGNTAVDSCIHDSCSQTDDEAYWTWYQSYCPATSSVGPVTSASSVPTGYPIPTANATTGYAWPSHSVAPATGGAGRVVAGGVTGLIALCGLLLL